MDTSRPDAETDVVVVGGGAAGCVVAARLAEDGSRSVILIEAGPDLRASIPDGLRDGWGMSRNHGWGYESELDDRGQVEPIHRGRLLGGTSWVTRFAVRGSPAGVGCPRERRLGVRRRAPGVPQARTGRGLRREAVARRRRAAADPPLPRARTGAGSRRGATCVRRPRLRDGPRPQ
ncbi:MAG: FAD-dependent oxidoreductase [Chloroflexi bacterium]|nr:MAG: FAD-dependent oxidoreductase [Chloroflexota bacterium]